MSLPLALCIIAIIVSILIGWKFNHNTGIIAICFAFAIGIVVMNMKAGDIINFWPITIIFYLISIGLFFNFAVDNGTMEALGQKMLHAMGGNAKLVPFAIAIVSGVVGGLGAGASTPAIVGPFAFVMARTAKINPALTAVAIAFGNLVGSNNPYNGYGGTIGKNLMLDNGLSEAMAMDYGLKIWANCTIISIIIIVLAYFFFKGHKAQTVTLGEKPAPFTLVQRKTMVIIIAAFVLMVIPPIAYTNAPGIAWLKTLNQLCQPQVIMMFGALVCALMQLADAKKVVRMVPWNTIIMIMGVYVLIKVAAAAGLVDAISGALSNNIPAIIVPGAIVFFAAFLSFFSSSTSTVMPLMYPLVPVLAASMSLNPVMLYTCIFFGGLSTAVSPFSTGGAITIAADPYDDEKEILPNKMIAVACIVPLITIVAAEVGLFSIFPG